MCEETAMAGTLNPSAKPRVPRVHRAPKPSISVVASTCLGRLATREAELRQRNGLRCLAGAAIIAAALGMLYGFVIFLGSSSLHPRGDGSPEPMQFAFILCGGLVLLTLPIAALMRPESRSDVAEQILRDGARSAPAGDNPFARLIIALVLLGLVYGEFMLVDSVKA
jgi:hypothetical protein